MRKATALTNDDSRTPDHPRPSTTQQHDTDERPSTAEHLGTDEHQGADERPGSDELGFEPVDAQPTASRPAPRGPRRAVKIGAGAAVSSICLALALSSTSTVSQSAAAPLFEPQAAPTANLPEIDMADRAIAAARSDRSANRTAFAFQTEEEDEPEVVGKRFATTDLNVRTKPDEDAKVVAVLDTGDKIQITDAKEDGWRQVMYKDKTRWVKSRYLSKDKPKPKPRGPSSAPCPSGSGGSGMENGLTSNAVKVHRAVCAAFPSVDVYGGIRGSGGNHGTGHAVDIMVSGGTGDDIAAYVRAHAAQLGVTEVIWSQRIWTTQRAGEGWRSMSDRGSSTANHYDHVHVTVR